MARADEVEVKSDLEGTASDDAKGLAREVACPVEGTIQAAVRVALKRQLISTMDRFNDIFMVFRGLI